MDNLKWLQEWYFNQFDGNWEHNYGIKIDTLDNPGWSVKIDLTGTDLEFKNFESITKEKSENDWIHCEVKDSIFEGYGGIFNLNEILNILRNWVESRKESVIIDVSNVVQSKELHHLLMKRLEFPNFYGMNWDAFWDAITGLVELPKKIEFVGWTILENNLPSEAKLLKDCLDQYNDLDYVEKREFLYH